MSRLTNDEIRNRAISIIRNLTAEENGLTHGDLVILSSFLLIERTDKDKLTHYKDLEEQGRLIDSDKAVDFGYLSDWYIVSVDENDEPVWTEKHLDELLADFILIPKEV